jgi:F-box protein 11
LRLTIKDINGPGIKVGKGNRSKIKGNDISKCVTGILSTSNRANIIMNNCYNNHESGIKTIAKKGIRCDTLVQFNFCTKNKQHGVFCVGENNFSVI